MNQQQKCSQCLQQFVILNPPRSMPSCEHNICTKCLKEAIQHRQQFIDCSFCSKKVKKRQIKLFPKNLKLLEKLKTTHITTPALTTPKTTKPSIEDNPLTKSQSQQKDDEQLLLTSEPQQSQENENSMICQIHKKPFEIICATQKKRICCHCAIFGTHKDHRFKTFVQFQQEINLKTLLFKEITKQKQETQTLQNLVNLKQNFTTKLSQRKSMLLNQVGKHFQQLITTIQTVQKSLSTELQQKFGEANKKLQQILSQQMNIKHNYLTWQNKCRQVINRLKMTHNLKNRIQCYYDSSLQICQEGKLYLDDMMERLSGLRNQIDDKVSTISIYTEQMRLDNFVTIAFPLLDQIQHNHQLDKIPQSSFLKDFTSSKNLLPTKEDLEENSFIFESEVSTIQLKDSLNQKTQIKNRLNKSVTSINDLKHLESIFTGLGIKGQEMKRKVNEKENQKEKQNKSHFGRTRSPTQRRFGSPDLSKNHHEKLYKTPQQILIALASHDFISQIDLSQMHLKDKEIFQFFQKVKYIRPIKAIKLQKNNLTDQGFQCICQFLQPVSNMNLSFNHLTDRCLDVMIRNKEYLYKMRIVNLSGNKLTKDKTDLKVKGKLEELKKLGIVVNL